MDHAHEATKLLLQNPLSQALLSHIRSVYVLHHHHKNSSALCKLHLSNGQPALTFRKGGCNHFSKKDEEFFHSYLDFLQETGQFRKWGLSRMSKIGETPESNVQRRLLEQSVNRQSKMELRIRNRALLAKISESAINRFKHSLLRHRHALSYKEEIQALDRSWHIRMVADADGAHTTHNHSFYFSTQSEAVANNEIEHALKSAKAQFKHIRKLPASFRELRFCVDSSSICSAAALQLV